MKEAWTKIVRFRVDDEYFDRLKAYYALPWYKRVFKTRPTPRKERTDV